VGGIAEAKAVAPAPALLLAWDESEGVWRSCDEAELGPECVSSGGTSWGCGSRRVGRSVCARRVDGKRNQERFLGASSAATAAIVGGGDLEVCAARRRDRRRWCGAPSSSSSGREDRVPGGLMATLGWKDCDEPWCEW
jgi:hypothetical protein